MDEHGLVIHPWSSNQIPAGIMPHSSIYDLCKYSLTKSNTCELSVRHRHREAIQ